VQNRGSSRRLFVFVLVAGIAVITGFWYFASGTSNDDHPTAGGEYVEGVTGAPSRVNPLFAYQNDADQTLTALVFAGLTRLDDRGSPYPDLASTWSVSPDGRTYVFALRPGLQWHDGAPLTASDVLFTYELLRDPVLPSGLPLARQLEGATVTSPDPLTIKIELPEPYAPLPAYLTLGILPVHLLTGQTVQQIGESFFNQQPVGSGPYRLDRLTPGEAMLSANAEYHLEQPFIQQLRLRFYRDDGELFSALDAGDVQGGLIRGVLGEREQLTLQRRNDLNVTPVVTGGVASVYFNLEAPLFQDRRVRQALLYGLDRGVMIGELVEGQAAVAQSPIVPGSWAYAPALERYDADDKQAGLLLDDAGWRRDGDGVRRKDGQPLAFAITTTPDPGNFAAAQAVAAEWNELGAQVQIVSIGTTTLVRDLIDSRQYDALLITQSPSTDPDPYPQWHTPSGNGVNANLSGFVDSRVDDLLEEARKASFPRRKEIYESFQELFAQEVPAIPLYAATAYYVQSSAVHDVRVGLLTQPGDRFWQVQEWFLKTR
jgi:peptide/nickel transport system substrate-binding protein